MDSSDRHSDSDKLILMFQAARLFLEEKLPVSKIAPRLNISREAVYPLLAAARDHDLIHMTAPPDRQLPDAIAHAYPQGDFLAKDIHVVETDQDGGHHVAARAAEIVLELVHAVAGRHDRSRRVTLGLCPGRASLDFMVHFARLVRNATHVPRLRLVSVASGSPAESPLYAATSFFALVPRDIAPDLQIEGVRQPGCIGLFAPPIVPRKVYDEIRDLPGVTEAFGHAKDVDIVVTSMGDIEDPHDLLREFLAPLKQANVLGILKKLECLGNVAYLPFSATGPIDWETLPYRAVTLFSIPDLVKMAGSKTRHVVMIARSCGVCGLDRVRVIKPLLTVPELKVWSKVVMDVRTARGLMFGHTPKEAPVVDESDGAQRPRRGRKPRK